MAELVHQIRFEPNGARDYAQPLTYAIFVNDAAGPALVGTPVSLELAGDGSFDARILKTAITKSSDVNGQVLFGWWEYPRGGEEQPSYLATLTITCPGDDVVLRIGAAF